jgi:alpha-glucosidase
VRAKTKDANPWWESATIYEIALISFQDSDGDGKGDLPGLLSRIEYLKWLGVDAIWLTPIYKSPFRDLGYDISDYCAVDPAFGSLEDIDRVIARLHEAGMRLILDLVPNHTSNDHDWFCESRRSRDNANADWYIWANPAETGGPPNNWLSRFGGSAWEWCAERAQYYYHSFLVEQPDLNWRNPQVRAAIADVMRFWLNRGTDGFRVDASAVLIKDDLLRDNPAAPESKDKPTPQCFTPVFTDDRPETMQCIEFIDA